MPDFGIYAGTSTVNQHPQRRLDELRDLMQKNYHQLRVNAYTGVNSRTERVSTSPRGH